MDSIIFLFSDKVYRIRRFFPGIKFLMKLIRYNPPGGGSSAFTAELAESAEKIHSFHAGFADGDWASRLSSEKPGKISWQSCRSCRIFRLL